MRVPALVLSLFFFVMLPSHTYSQSTDDSFISGYAVSVLEREFHIPSVSLRVQDGVVYVNPDKIPGVDSAELVTILLGIKGVKRVEIISEGQAIPANDAEESRHEPLRERIYPEDDPPVKKVFPRKERLFDPLLADPRWPNFSGAYHYYINNDELEKVFAASVGDVIPMYTGQVPFAFGGMWQVGGEAGAFVIHDLDTVSWDQVNADYIFGFIAAYRKGPLSGIFRVFHQSSHIGDEYLLHNDVERENYSYEALGLMLSDDIGEWLRIYGGGEYHFSRSPKELKPWVAHYGLELKGTGTFLRETFRPVAAVDIKHKEDNDWSGEVSLKTGVQVENDHLIHHQLRVMIGYFNGHSPNGQFYKQSEEIISVGFYYNY